MHLVYDKKTEGRCRSVLISTTWGISFFI